MDKKEIKNLVNGYNLMDILEDRLQIIINGGVARSTIYKAFQVGGKTPTLEIILREAEAVVKEHEQTVQNALISFEPAA